MYVGLILHCWLGSGHMWNGGNNSWIISGGWLRGQRGFSAWVMSRTNVIRIGYFSLNIHAQWKQNEDVHATSTHWALASTPRHFFQIDTIKEKRKSWNVIGWREFSWPDATDKFDQHNKNACACLLSAEATAQTQSSQVVRSCWYLCLDLRNYFNWRLRLPLALEFLLHLDLIE
jgi:hypothetical protein